MSNNRLRCRPLSKLNAVSSIYVTVTECRWHFLFYFITGRAYVHVHKRSLTYSQGCNNVSGLLIAGGFWLEIVIQSQYELKVLNSDYPSYGIWSCAVVTIQFRIGWNLIESNELRSGQEMTYWRGISQRYLIGFSCSQLVDDLRAELTVSNECYIDSNRLQLDCKRHFFYIVISEMLLLQK